MKRFRVIVGGLCIAVALLGGEGCARQGTPEKPDLLRENSPLETSFHQTGAITFKMNPGQPVTDLTPYADAQCTEKLMWKTFEGENVCAIYYPVSHEPVTHKLQAYVNSLYYEVAKHTGVKTQIGSQFYLVALSQLPPNYTFLPPSGDAPSYLALWVGGAENVEENEQRHHFYAANTYFLLNTLTSMALRSTVKFDHRNSTAWFEMGFAEHMNVKITNHLAPHSEVKPYSPQEVIRWLESPTTRKELFEWKQGNYYESNSIFERGDRRALEKFWEKEDDPVRASRAVLQAAETIAGEEFLKHILRSLQTRGTFKPVTNEDIFVVIKKNVGVDIRDWDAFLQRYREVMSETEHLKHRS